MKTKTPRTDKVEIGTEYLDSVPSDFARQLERELNDWRECATKLANATVKAVPLICLDPEERQAGELFDKLTRAAEPSNSYSQPSKDV